MIDTVSIRNRLLELAFQGKLYSVSDDNDTVDRMFESIPAPSAKRRKLLSVGSSVKFPYDIPDHWRCVPLGVISTYGDKVEKTKANVVDESTWVLELEDIASGGGLLVKKRATDRHSIGEKSIFNAGQILYSKLRPYLKKVLLADEGGICTPELVAFDVLGEIDPMYIVFYLMSPFVDKVINMRSYGIKMPRVDSEFMANLPVPIPTANEQKEIVTRLGKAFELIDIISMNQNQYESNKEALKTAIINLGIRGKLTEQLPEDGTADELYTQIQEEKQKLISEKKLKKDKTVDNANLEDVPFEIPSNWKWVRWGEIVNVVSARRVHQSDWCDSGIPFYRAREIAKLAEYGTVDNDLFISEDLYNEFAKESVPKAGDLMVSAVGTLGRTYVVKDSDLFYYKDASVLCFENYAKLNSQYMKYVMESTLMKNQILSNSGGTTVDTLTMVRMNSYLIPLPPLEEQRRIVDVINKMKSIIC